MGCCRNNPCSSTGCVTSDLYPARLSDNPNKAQIFLSGSSTASTASTDSDSSSDSALPIGAIIGIVLGAVALLGILIAFFLMYRKGWLGKKRNTEKQADEVANLYSPSVQGRFVNGWPGSQPGSPPPFPPYSPMYNDHLSSTASDWNGDSRHISQVSGMTWSDASTNAAHKHYSMVQQGPPASELDGMIRTNKAPQGQQTMELEGQDTEIPRVTAELPANGS
ncbi:hypothetical protein DL770_001590 [Monosporascus sp. CRB-9-2]|nr:hypothetical protein DL770_001590 [Monosporascus sp. CRB-9-2]